MDSQLLIFNIVVAGSRSFNNYQILEDRLDFLLQNIKNKYIINIVSGEAKGADYLGEVYAARRRFGIIRKPANWKKYGKSAGYIRNKEMAKIANAVVVFWDGQSSGSKHMIDLAIENKLPTVVYTIENNEIKEFINYAHE